MSDYGRTNDFSVKDALPAGDANKKIKGSDVDAELDAAVVAIATKSNKIASATEGAFVIQTSTGDIADGGTVISTYAKTVLDDANAEAARLTLETQSAANGSTIMETGTTAQRDGSPVAGYARLNTDNSLFEGYNGAAWVNMTGDVPSGTVMLFYQATAPSGWTILTTPDDVVVTIDDENGGTTGGTGDITAGVTSASESSHTHGAGTYAAPRDPANDTGVLAGGTQCSLNDHLHDVTGTSGAGSAHSHTVSAAFAKCIFATKD